MFRIKAHVHVYNHTGLNIVIMGISAERKIHKVLVDHHFKLTKVINKKLEEAEERIGGVTRHPHASTATHNTIVKESGMMERNEDSLRLALQRRRQRKSLKEHPARPSVGSQQTTTAPTVGDHALNGHGDGWEKGKIRFKLYRRHPEKGCRSPLPREPHVGHP